MVQEPVDSLGQWSQNAWRYTAPNLRYADPDCHHMPTPTLNHARFSSESIGEGSREPSPGWASGQQLAAGGRVKVADSSGASGSTSRLHGRPRQDRAGG